MDTLPVVRHAGHADLDTLVDTLSDSFACDPMLNWLFPKAGLYPQFFRLLVEEVYLPRGIVHMEQGGLAAALWLPPQERFEMAPRFGLLKFGFNLVRANGLRAIWRARQQGAIFSKHYPSLEPHYYLQFIGCRSNDQGRGIGSSLLKEGLRVCDEHSMPAYLECSNIRNVALYERHGFEVRAKEEIGKHGPTVWFMWRDAR